MALSDPAAVKLMKSLFPMWLKEREKLDRIDRWARWDHEDPDKPRQATAEYKELVARSQAPWGDLIVSSVAQTLYVEGYRRPDAPDDGAGWDHWQRNGMDSRQVPLHRAALTYGLAYVTVFPGTTLSGERAPVMRGVSPREMLAVYADPAGDDWPEFAIRVAASRGSTELTLLDSTHRYRLRVKDTKDWESDGPMVVDEHGSGVCPVVRYANRFDLEGRAAGEIEPFIPVLGRIDQTAFDRLVVQRFSSWVVRTISGMSVAESAAASGTSPARVKMLLKVEDLLTAEDPDTKFGSLPATPLDGFIKAHESDLTVLAATSQTPAFELLGQMANMSAEALAAAKSSQTAKGDERRHTFGESHEQALRLACHQAGDTEGAADFRAQVRWADTSIRSLAQAVDALGKMATMLGFPPELLWAKVPGITNQDVDEAKRKLAEGGAMENLLREISNAQAPSIAPAVLPPAA